MARHGHTVVVAEASDRVGGKILDYCCKATDSCSRCGVCVAHTAVAEAIAHPRIRFLTACSVSSVRYTSRRMSVRMHQDYPFLSMPECNGCGACIEACPASCIRKDVRGGVSQVTIEHHRCLRRRGKQCEACVRACPAGALSGEGAGVDFEITAAAALVAVGHEPYDPRGKPALGYGRLPGVLTAAEAERLLSRQSCLCKPDEDVAFIQCVGSRDTDIGRGYCSSVCCAYASRLAWMMRHRNPGSRLTIYHIDLQNFDKAFTDLHRRFLEVGIGFVRALPSGVDSTPEGRLRLHLENSSGTAAVEHDRVVLSVGMGPARGAADVASRFGLDRDAFGFLSSRHPNVFVAGTCERPQSISDSMTAARSAAAAMLSRLPGEHRAERPAMPAGVKTQRVPVERHVLVIGGGLAGLSVAGAVHDFGHRVTLIEASPNLGGKAAMWMDTEDAERRLTGVQVMRETRLEALEGNVGRFRAVLRSPTGRDPLLCGAVVVCSGTLAATGSGELPASCVDIQDLPAFMAACPARERPESVAVVLDVVEEETRAETEMAFREALRLREEYDCDVTLFCREVRVASLDLEGTYSRVRESGIDVFKYEGELHLEREEGGVRITAHDAVLDEPVRVLVGAAAVSRWGMGVTADSRMMELLRIGGDAQGQMQEDNVHLFPAMTSRPGIFVVGSCRGERYAPALRRDALAAALDVHSLLSGGALVAPLTNAQVEPSKCALCLTCIRTCPHGAMQVDREKQSAVSIPEVCRRCGVCVGECPAGAITLPEQGGEG